MHSCDTHMNDEAACCCSFLRFASSRSVGADLLSYCFFSATSRIQSCAESAHGRERERHAGEFDEGRARTTPCAYSH